MKYLNSIMLVAAVSLTACGSSEASLEDLQESADALYERIDLMEATLLSDMPTTGSARYEGVGAYSGTTADPDSIMANPSSYSNVDVNVNFASGQVTGSAYNFKSAADDATIDGEITINGNVSGNTIVGTFSGSLQESIDTGDVSVSANVAYNGMVEGAFAGDNADAIAAQLIGVGTVSGEAIPVYGIFGAEK